MLYSNVKTTLLLAIFSLSIGLTNCGQVAEDSGYLLAFQDEAKGEYGYKNQNGDIVIPSGKYSYCFTDTFRTFAIVAEPTAGFVAIDREEKILYKIFPYDNGPDYPSDGLFRILENDKIGYADSATGSIVIKPQFDCAWPFENGVAKVSMDCKTQEDGEHSIWESDNWYHIDKTGSKVDQQ